MNAISFISGKTCRKQHRPCFVLPLFTIFSHYLLCPWEGAHFKWRWLATLADHIQCECIFVCAFIPGRNVKIEISFDSGQSRWVEGDCVLFPVGIQYISSLARRCPLYWDGPLALHVSKTIYYLDDMYWILSITRCSISAQHKRIRPGISFFIAAHTDRRSFTLKAHWAPVCQLIDGW